MIALMLLAGFIFYMAVAVTCSRLSYIGSKSKGRAIGVLAIFVLVPVADVILNVIALSYYCVTDYGVKILDEKKVQSIYFSDNNYGCTGNCLKSLLKYKLDFVEANVTIPSLNSFSETKSLYRYSISKLPDPSCDIFLKFAEKNKSSRFAKSNFGFPKGTCLSALPVNSINSDVEYRALKDSETETKLLVDLNQAIISDVQDGKILAFKSFYRTSKGWAWNAFLNISRNPSSITCKSIGIRVQPILYEAYLGMVTRAL